LRKPFAALSFTALPLAAIAMLASFPSFACTVFELNPQDGKHHVVFGRNYDWPVEVGLVLVNKRDMRKTALLMNGGKAATWTARHGSLTFNQFGRDLPNGGINEAGLVIEVLWLNDTNYAASDARPALNALAWIQYQLDTAATVAEVIASDKDVRISPEFSPKLHYFVCEQSGACATIEFVKGKMVAHRSGDSGELPLRVLANDTYAESLEHWQGLGKVDSPHDIGGNRDASLNRFSRAAVMVKAYDAKPDKPAVDYAFSILQEVYFGRLTAWSIVYDDTSKHVFFNTRANSKVRTLDLAKFDFSCSTPMKMMDINAAGSGDVSGAMLNYNEAGNRMLLQAAMSETRLTSSLPSSVMEAIARHAESATCAK
jgi:choloylglycine hydrolase